MHEQPPYMQVKQGSPKYGEMAIETAVAMHGDGRRFSECSSPKHAVSLTDPGQWATIEVTEIRVLTEHALKEPDACCNEEYGLS